MIARAIALLLLMMTPAWAACPLPGQKPMLLVKMYFGQTMASGRAVAPRAWTRFLSDAVTARFPDGFTVYDTTGQWMGPKMSRPGREHSKVVEIATTDSPASRNAVTDIANDYRAAFHQQSVGIVTSMVCGKF